MDYSKTFSSLLRNSVLFRHLINKAKNRTKIVVKLKENDYVTGVLKGYDFYLKMIEVEGEDGTYFVNLHHIQYIKVYEDTQKKNQKPKKNFTKNKKPKKPEPKPEMFDPDYEYGVDYDW